jgi:D-glycero-D-manno-heptose 1,7-bisphosphate phosphatase
MGKRAIFLDRDGVINSYAYNSDFGTVDSPSTPDEFQLLLGVPEAIRAFRSLGFVVVVVSNQPGIAKGKFSLELLQATTDKMVDACWGNIEAIYYCLHHPNAVLAKYRADCACRKPKPGLLLQAAKDLDLDLGESVMIGDGLTDIMAGRSAGARTILVNPRKCYLCDALAAKNVMPDFIVANLAEAVPIVELIGSRHDPRLSNPLAEGGEFDSFVASNFRTQPLQQPDMRPE